MSDEQKNFRPPVIVVLGHVDHGKTTLLDYIRKSNVAAGESGGITQHIGAYQIEVHSPDESKSRESEANLGTPRQIPRDDFVNIRKITFLDTPGHEAFSEMRRRGARVADIAVLVVAADEGLKPQTREALEHIKKAELPYVVALNKIDKPNADPNRVKKELSEAGVLVEGWGGNVPIAEVSAKTGTGVPELLDLLGLLWELEAKTANPSVPARGVVIESHLDARRGPVATFLVQEGILKEGGIVRCGSAFGKVKALEDFQGRVLEMAGPATPAVVLGLGAVPTLGDECIEEKNEAEAQEHAAAYTNGLPRETARGKVISATPDLPAERILLVTLKTDVKGSEEAILEALQRYQFPEVGLHIISSGVGDVGEADIKAAESMKAEIIGFRVKVPTKITTYAEQRRVRVITFDLIYELLAAVRKELNNLLPAEIIKKPFGSVKLLAIFRREKDGIIIGGRVTKGTIPRGATCEIMRGEKTIGEGRLKELKIGKDAVEEVRNGAECGMLYVGTGSPAEGDIVEVFEKEERRKEL